MTQIKVHWSFWLIALLGIIWSALGVMNYIMQTTNPEFVASFPELQRSLIENRPNWATAGFAVSVFSGLFGSLLLLIKKPLSFYFLLLSLLGTMLVVVHVLQVAGATADFGLPQLVMMAGMPFIVSSILAWYPKLAQKRGWLK
jgi:hypothetical protein